MRRTTSVAPARPRTTIRVINLSPTPWFIPPHTGGPNDEFWGNGPDVLMSIDLVPRDGQLEVHGYMRAYETKPDWTKAEGGFSYVGYQAGPSERIVRVVGTRHSEHRYTDSTRERDVFPVNDGLVREYIAVGDVDGGDAGKATGFNASFLPVTLEIQKIRRTASRSNGRTEDSRPKSAAKRRTRRTPK